MIEGGLSSSYTINYAASTASSIPTTSRFFTEHSDASTAQNVGGGFMLVGDDEDQKLRLYDRANSGLPVTGFDYTSSLALTDLSGGLPREVDLESSARVGSRIYWMGSLSNASSGNARPNRNRIFATDLSGTGSSTTLSYVGRYDGLKQDLLNWDSSNLHGEGANFYGLSTSAAAGVIPEAADGSGFNVEGLSASPDDSSLFIAFGALISPASSRTKALIVPLTNFASLVSGNPSSGPATFGTPIELELGGRGIRELKCSSTAGCLIVAGPADSATGTAPKNFRKTPHSRRGFSFQHKHSRTNPCWIAPLQSPRAR